MQDIAIRLAVYLEGLKAYQSSSLDSLAKQISTELGQLLAQGEISEMSQSRLARVIAQVRRSPTMDNYTSQLLIDLQDLFDALYEVNTSVWVSAKEDQQNIIPFILALAMLKPKGIYGKDALDKEALRKRIASTVIPATGMEMLPFITQWAANSKASIERTIKQAWANKWTNKELAEKLLKITRQGKSSQLTKITNSGKTVIETVISHMGAQVEAAISSSLFDEYAWSSVMDGSTTDICRHRNMRIYVYGKGPLPPAHWGCRSHIIPLGKGIPEQLTFKDWLANQPGIVQRDILKSLKIHKDGRLVSSAINLEEFRGKINLIMAL